MRTLIFRDQRFFYKQKENIPVDTLFTVSSKSASLEVYVKREGILSIFSPYKKIGQFKGNKNKLAGNRVLKKIVSDYLDKEENKPLVIDCSPEIHDLYK